MDVSVGRERKELQSAGCLGCLGAAGGMGESDPLALSLSLFLIILMYLEPLPLVWSTSRQRTSTTGPTCGAFVWLRLMMTYGAWHMSVSGRVMDGEECWFASDVSISGLLKASIISLVGCARVFESVSK